MRYVRRSNRPRRTNSSERNSGSTASSRSSRRENPLTVTGITYTKLEVLQGTRGLRIAASELSVIPTRPSGRVNRAFRVLLKPEDRTILIYGETAVSARVESSKLTGSLPVKTIQKFIETSDIRINSQSVYEDSHPRAHFSELAHKFRLPEGCRISLSSIMIRDTSSVTAVSASVIPTHIGGSLNRLTINLFDSARFYSSLTNGLVSLGVFGKSKARFSVSIPFQSSGSGVVDGGVLPSVVRALEIFLHDEGKVSGVAVEDFVDLKVFSPHCECSIYTFPECVNITESYHGPPGTSMPIACKIQRNERAVRTNVVHTPHHSNNARVLDRLSSIVGSSANTWINSRENFNTEELEAAIRQSELSVHQREPSFAFENQNDFSTFVTNEQPKFPIIAPKTEEDDSVCSICYSNTSTFVASCSHRVCCHDCIGAFQRGIENCPYCRIKITFVFPFINSPSAAAATAASSH